MIAVYLITCVVVVSYSALGQFAVTDRIYWDVTACGPRLRQLALTDLVCGCPQSQVMCRPVWLIENPNRMTFYGPCEQIPEVNPANKIKFQTGLGRIFTHTIDRC